MGNSEVGHMNIGSGRVVPQGVVVIDAAIRRRRVRQQPHAARAIAHVERTGGTLHLMGLLSDGRVHSSIDAPLRADRRRGRSRRAARDRCFLDGRDTPPRSAATYVERLEAKLAARRTRRRDRQRQRPLLCDGPRPAAGSGPSSPTTCSPTARADIAPTTRACRGRAAYARGEDDEFVVPTIVGAPRPIDDGDAFIFFNFRPDRARQLTTAFDAGTAFYYDDGFGVFASKRYRDPFFATMTNYDENFPNPVLFGPRPQYDTFGEIVARAGLAQLRLAETEKYAHVTYFFNGGREDEFAGEDRELIPSDRSRADLRPRARDARARDHRRRRAGDRSGARTT